MYKLWRKDDPVLSDSGAVIKGGMWGHQREWWSAPNFIKALVAGYGSGKTFIGVKRAISLALANGQAAHRSAPCPHLWVSPTYKVAKKTVIPLLEQLLDGKATLDREFKYIQNKSDHSFTIRHGQRKGLIWIASGDEPDSLKGPTVGSATIDEPFIQAKEVFDQCIARIRDPRALVKELDLIGTPEQLNWGYDVCEGEEAHRHDIKIVHAHTKENRAIGSEYYLRLESSYDDKAVKAYVGGQFIDLSHGTVYYGFSRLANVIDLPDPGHELEVGMDFNVNPMAAVVFWRNGPHMHIVDEIEIENADTDYLCSYLRDTYVYKSGEREGQCRITAVYPDASGKSRHTNAPGGKSDFHYITAAGFNLYVKESNPGIRDRENAVNAKLKPSLNRAPTLTISPKCKKLRKYFLTYTHENKGKPEGKRMSHLVDALGYPVAYLFPIVKPIIIATKFSGA